jgi:TPR repeat protein
MRCAWGIRDCYAFSKGVEKDVMAKAARLDGQAAEQSHADAKYNICYSYHKVTGMEVKKM